MSKRGGVGPIYSGTKYDMAKPVKSEFVILCLYICGKHFERNMFYLLFFFYKGCSRYNTIWIVLVSISKYQTSLDLLKGHIIIEGDEVVASHITRSTRNKAKSNAAPPLIHPWYLLQLRDF